MTDSLLFQAVMKQKASIKRNVGFLQSLNWAITHGSCNNEYILPNRLMWSSFIWLLDYHGRTAMMVLGRGRHVQFLEVSVEDLVLTV
jgi:hypothetical protein